MRAYLRSDGMYDTYQIEPEVLSAEEVQHIQKQEELAARKEELLKELATIENELQGEPPVECNQPTAESPQEAPLPVDTVVGAQPTIRKRW